MPKYRSSTTTHGRNMEGTGETEDKWGWLDQVNQ